jgi:hypothetical protein
MRRGHEQGGRNVHTTSSSFTVRRDCLLGEPFNNCTLGDCRNTAVAYTEPDMAVVGLTSSLTASRPNTSNSIVSDDTYCCSSGVTTKDMVLEKLNFGLIVRLDVRPVEHSSSR